MSNKRRPVRLCVALAVLFALFFASGSSEWVYPVIWQRLLAAFSRADVFSVAIVASAFVGGVGCGNLAGGHIADRLSRVADRSALVDVNKDLVPNDEFLHDAKSW